MGFCILSALAVQRVLKILVERKPRDHIRVVESLCWEYFSPLELCLCRKGPGVVVDSSVKVQTQSLAVVKRANCVRGS